jgi:hypothetical protein
MALHELGHDDGRSMQNAHHKEKTAVLERSSELVVANFLAGTVFASVTGPGV